MRSEAANASSTSSSGKVPLRAGAFLWLVLAVAMLPSFPDSPRWMIWLSLVYPAIYTAASIHLHRKTRR